MEHADQKKLLKYARDIIMAQLDNSIVSVPDVNAEPSGVFVTLHKHSHLRGCIGYIQADDQPLIQTIKDSALAAAFRDNRFPPVKISEMADIDLEISVISPFRQVEDITDIQIGVHGLMMRKGMHSGLFLPQVPVEQNWQLNEYLDNLCLKAGLTPGSQNDPETVLYSFSAEVFGEKQP